MRTATIASARTPSRAGTRAKRSAEPFTAGTCMVGAASTVMTARADGEPDDGVQDSAAASRGPPPYACRASRPNSIDPTRVQGGRITTGPRTVQPAMLAAGGTTCIRDDRAPRCYEPGTTRRRTDRRGDLETRASEG